MTKEQIKQIVEKENVKYLILQFTDMLGTVKSVEVPSKCIDTVLNNEQMFDGSSIEGFVRIKEADMFLKPDLDTFLILPLEENNYGKTARIICDILDSNKNEFLADPRTILKKTLEKMNQLGYKDFNVGLEPEFYLFKMNNGEICYSDTGSYFDMAPFDITENCRKDIVLELEKLNFNVESSHHEVGPGQNEINCHFTDALKAADNLQTFKYIVKQIATKHGLIATFMPKPFKNIAGNGMHVNCSLTNYKNENIFYSENSKNNLSDTAYKFISGIINNAKELSLITNPVVNSYKRLVPGFEAPCYICWGSANRSGMIRIPSAKKNKTRIEVRNPDSAANPYLLLSGILAAGLEGIENDYNHIEENKENIYSLTEEEINKKEIEKLPETLKEAIDYFEESSFCKKTFGELLYKKYLKAKKIQWQEYKEEVHNFERKKYLDL